MWVYLCCRFGYWNHQSLTKFKWTPWGQYQTNWELFVIEELHKINFCSISIFKLFRASGIFTWSFKLQGTILESKFLFNGGREKNIILKYMKFWRKSNWWLIKMFKWFLEYSLYLAKFPLANLFNNIKKFIFNVK